MLQKQKGWGGGARRRREAECRGGSEEGAHSTGTLPWKPSCIGSQLPKSVRIPETDLEGGPGGAGGGNHCPVRPKGAPSLWTQALLLSPFPASSTTAPGALAPARQSQIWPSWRVGGNTARQVKQPGRAVRSKAEKDNFSGSRCFAFHLSGSIWTTQMYLFSHPRWL